LWFAGNAVLNDLVKNSNIRPDFLANLTSSVQIGFIVGTLVFAVFTLSDRFSPSRVFFSCSILAALFNLGLSLEGISSPTLLTFRFLTGFFLAGIYPVGMKIASDYYQKGLGKSLGLLVGALVLGTAFPHLLKSITTDLPWRYVIYSTSALSILGGLMILLLVPDGPFRKPAQELKLTAFLSGFRNKNFRTASLGYFGHMWELYAFWAFVPVMLTTNKYYYYKPDLNVSLLSFLIIASGGIACAFSGLFSERVGIKRLATVCLLLSCACCLVSPLFLFSSSTTVLVSFLFFWGLVVIADSPLFSTLVAQHAPEESRGTSLTMVTSIGFLITIVSIQLMRLILTLVHEKYAYVILAIGPVIGLIALFRRNQTVTN
jgi:MFS family permease